MIFLLILILPIILWFAKWCTNYIPHDMAKFWSYIAVVITCYMALIGDEIIGGIQFAYLCHAGPGLEVLVDDLEGRRYQFESVMTQVQLLPVKIHEKQVVMKDVGTGKAILKYSLYYAFSGGWLAHWTNLNGFKGPYLYSDSCNRKLEVNDLILRHNMSVQE